MKLFCQSCGTRYKFPDEELPGRLVRLKCRRCGAEIVLDGALPVRDLPVFGEGSTFVKQSPTRLQDAATRDQTASSSRASRSSHTSASRRTVGSQPSPGAGRAARPGRNTSSTRAWFVAVGQSRDGPMPASEVVRRIEMGSVDGATLIWHDDLDGWRPASEIPELATHLAALASNDLTGDVESSAPRKQGARPLLPPPIPDRVSSEVSSQRPSQTSAHAPGYASAHAPSYASAHAPSHASAHTPSYASGQPIDLRSAASEEQKTDEVEAATIDQQTYDVDADASAVEAEEDDPVAFVTDSSVEAANAVSEQLETSATSGDSSGDTIPNPFALSEEEQPPFADEDALFARLAAIPETPAPANPFATQEPTTADDDSNALAEQLAAIGLGDSPDRAEPAASAGDDADTDNREATPSELDESDPPNPLAKKLDDLDRGARELDHTPSQSKDLEPEDDDPIARKLAALSAGDEPSKTTKHHDKHESGDGDGDGDGDADHDREEDRDSEEDHDGEEDDPIARKLAALSAGDEPSKTTNHHDKHESGDGDGDGDADHDREDDDPIARKLAALSAGDEPSKTTNHDDKRRSGDGEEHDVLARKLAALGDVDASQSARPSNADAREAASDDTGGHDTDANDAVGDASIDGRVDGRVDGGVDGSVDEPGLISEGAQPLSTVLNRLPAHDGQSSTVRESTRFFLAAAGLSRQRARQQVMKGIAFAAALTLILVGAGLATDFIQIAIPATHHGTDEEESALDPHDGSATEPLQSRQLNNLIDHERRPKGPSNRSRSRTNAHDEGAASSQKHRKANTDAEDDAHDGQMEHIPVEFPAIEHPSDDISHAPPPNKHIEALRKQNERDQAEREEQAAALDEAEEATLSPKTIARVVADQTKSVDACYTHVKYALPRTSERLQVSVTIEPSGIVSRAVVVEDIAERSIFGDCVAERVRGWRFPPYHGRPLNILVPFLANSGASSPKGTPPKQKRSKPSSHPH
ncbi:MAG: zinc-ribbon domain-containing protein [Deltaproteobacteria bacterium]|nr:zinc-ribbon domain-containing protein [Deltaproteobacteria bacterium]